jgi:hypothetical protein
MASCNRRPTSRPGGHRPCLGEAGEAALFDVATRFQSHTAADLFAATMVRKPLRTAAAE